MEDSAFKNVCRTCLTENGEFKSVFISDEGSGINIHLAEMIMAYASVQITLGDGLPELICSKCAEKAVDLYLFKLCCEKSDAALRQQLGKSPYIQECDRVPPLEPLKDDIDRVSPLTVDIIIKPEIALENEECHVSQPAFGQDNDNYTDGEEDVKEKMFGVQCDICKQQFFNDMDLKKHKKTHVVKDYICNTCGKAFSRDDLLLRHKIIHAIKMDTQDKFSAIDGDAWNKRTASETEETNQCDSDNIFVNMPTPNDLIKKEVEVLPCKICPKKFNKPALLSRHMKIHAAVKPHICKTCNRMFARAEQLVNHMNVHTGVKPHVCGICSKGFNQISNLKDHMRTHNGEKPFLCSTCGKGFNQLGNLRQHTIRHSGIKAHLCSICGNGFASKGELCAHLRKHTGARPFVCQVCNHGFTTSSSLTKHKRIHSGEKPYECEVCKMKFSRSGILARHRRTHTGEKPYVCKFCSKAFSQSNDLSSHLRIHTGEKPFICDSCGQAFRQSSALKTHKKTHMDRSTMLDSRTVIGHMVHSTFLNSL